MQPLIDALFDRIHVIGLPDAAERRAHVRAHFAEAGITRYAFFDATGADDPKVAEAFAAGRVATYPNCFRCGALRCGRTDCNNVLIPAQVANFLTHLRLWEHIAATPQRALVVEDDVLFAASAADTLARLRTEVEAGRLTFEPATPRLLRLGWAHGPDHDAPAPFALGEDERMSNPCHAMTSAFARALLDRFWRIDTTSDLFLHRHAPRPGEAVTVFPPLASELSWSTGALASQIHPKPVRSEYLRREGRLAEAEANDRALAEHTGHIAHRPFLLLGFPARALAGAQAHLAAVGLEVGLEADGADGIASTLLAADGANPAAADRLARTRSALHWQYLLHPLCNLGDAVGPALETLREDPELARRMAGEIRRHTGIDPREATSEIERAVLTVVLWTRLIDARHAPHVSFRIELDAVQLFGRLRPLGGPFAERAGPAAETPALPPAAPPPPPEVWEAMSPRTLGLVRWYCVRFGYPLPWRPAAGVTPPPAPPRVSVVVPIHDTERYVEKCLRSIMAQTFRDFEIVCVDDCSPDGSTAIVERLMAEDPRIRLIRHDRNRGLGGARNTGIAAARAAYIASVDSDDHIARDMLQKLWDGGAAEGADIVATGAHFVNEAGEIEDGPDGTGFSRRTHRLEAERGQIDIFKPLAMAFWNKMYRRALFVEHDIWFPENLYYEDIATTPRLYAVARDIRMVQGKSYHYLQRPGSITKSTGARQIFDYFTAFDILREFLREHALMGRYGQAFVQFMSNNLQFHTRHVLALAAAAEGGAGEAGGPQAGRGADAGEALAFYLRLMLMLKDGYTRHGEALEGLDAEALSGLLHDDRGGEVIAQTLRQRRARFW
mgnify:CR=1 FL=1